jgi:hypothetical protein
LATLYGQPADLNDNELHAKNRVMWNRYMASHIDEKLKDYLIKRKSHSTEELTPFAEYELRNVEATFAERSKNRFLAVSGG